MRKKGLSGTEQKFDFVLYFFCHECYNIKVIVQNSFDRKKSGEK